jgi:mannose-6-phosphate isomerase-like protein (cupin superfamily)
MRYVRPFDPASIAPGESQTLLDAEEGLSCHITLRRGNGAQSASVDAQERFALVLAGEGALNLGDDVVSAVPGDMLFIPAGASGAFFGGPDAVWVETRAPLDTGATSTTDKAGLIKIDQSKFEGDGFAYQAMIDRASGSGTMRINVLQVQPGSGSPDYHIHEFAQIYVIQDGEMTLDVGRRRIAAPANSIVVLPEGVVHRNFNASGAVERHVSLLVPEPKVGAVFDYAVSIHDEEATMLTSIPA